MCEYVRACVCVCDVHICINAPIAKQIISHCAINKVDIIFNKYNIN